MTEEEILRLRIQRETERVFWDGQSAWLRDPKRFELLSDWCDQIDEGDLSAENQPIEQKTGRA